MRLFPPDTRQWRAHASLFTITFVIAVLLTAFFQTQVLSKEMYTLRSEENRLRPVVIPAARGMIYDRFGEVVATSVPRFKVLLIPADEETIRQALMDLSPFLGLAGAEVERVTKQRAARPHELLTVVEDATFVQAAALEERRAAFPHVMVVNWPRRYYPAGAAVGHMVGYVSEISEESWTFRATGRQDTGRAAGSGRRGSRRSTRCASAGRTGRDSWRWTRWGGS